MAQSRMPFPFSPRGETRATPPRPRAGRATAGTSSLRSLAALLVLPLVTQPLARPAAASWGPPLPTDPAPSEQPPSEQPPSAAPAEPGASTPPVEPTPAPTESEVEPVSPDTSDPSAPAEQPQVDSATDPQEVAPEDALPEAPLEPRPPARPPAEQPASVTPPPVPVPPATETTSTATESADDELPEALPPLQQAGWWTLFGAFAVGTTAGIFGGLAERQEDRVARLLYNKDSAGRSPLYADVADEYERDVRRGVAFERAAIGLAATTGALAIAALTLFIVDAKRGRKQRATTAQQRSLLEVRF